MILFVDANVILSDPYLGSSRWDALGQAGDTVTVCTSVVAVREVVARYKDQLGSLAADLDAIKRRSRGVVGEHVEAAVDATGVQAREYEEALTSRMRQLGWDMLEVPTDVDHSELADWAIHRVRPFDKNGNGYRDALHWVTFRSLMEADPDEDYVVLSNDRKAFADDYGDLHPDLKSDAAEYLEAGDVALCTKLTEVEIPGRYRQLPAEFELFDELEASLKESLMGSYVDPAKLGFSDADELTLVGVSDLRENVLVARRLADGSGIEVLFTYMANVELGVAYFDDASLVTSIDRTEWRRVLLTGIASADSQQSEIQDIETLTIEIDPDRYNVGDVLEAGLEPGYVKRSEREAGSWRRASRTEPVLLWDFIGGASTPDERTARVE
ncbi:PIN domain-containing protein [Leifsonia aquatica]|uniref:PIN domain-containing protein n=1 Tax=Leifsonia aquatica TaxID=144185 RepID=UPI003804A573